MNSFRTIVQPDKPGFSLSHKDRIVSIGSCFSENIGRKFGEHKFRININPFGQQYNPFSVAKAIHRLTNPVLYTKSDLIYHDELYHSFDHHGSFSRTTEVETLKVINENLLAASEDLKKATVLFLTFGTSHVFKLKENGSIVSNCHKLSGNHFSRELMNAEEILKALENSINDIWTINPAIKIILTVSPVRYFAFGIHENSVSKSLLFVAIHELQRKRPGLYYFPAYELVMDDLRDYRFFAEDMVHPNHQATDYVWESLCQTMMDKPTLELMKEIEEINLALKHRPRNPESEAHKKFMAKNEERIERLREKWGIEF